MRATPNASLYPSYTLNPHIRVLVLITLMLPRIKTRHGTALFTAPRISSEPALLLKLIPSLHRDLGAVKLALVFNTRLLGLFTSSLAGIAPREVIEFPEGVGREDEVPDGEGDQVDQHPDDV